MITFLRGFSTSKKSSIMFALAGLGAGILAAVFPEGSFLLLLAVLALLIDKIVTVALLKKIDVFHPWMIFIAYLGYLTLGFAPNPVVRWYHHIKFNDKITTFVLVSIVIFALGLLIGRIIVQHRVVSNRHKETPQVDGKRVLCVSLFFTLVGVFYLLWGYAVTGSIALLSPDAVEARRIATDRGGAYVYFQTFFAVIGTIILLSYSLISKRFRLLSILTFGIVVLLLLGTGNRVNLLRPLVLAAMAFHYLKGHLTLRKALILLLALLVVTGVLQWLRMGRPLAADNIVEVFVNGYYYAQASTGAGLRILQQVLDVFGTQYDFWLGRYNLYSFVTLLPGKQAMGGDQYLGRVLFNRPRGQPPAFPGGLYIDFGYPGVIIGVLLAAVALQWLYSMRPGPDNLFAVWAYATTVLFVIWNFYVGYLYVVQLDFWFFLLVFRAAYAYITHSKSWWVLVLYSAVMISMGLGVIRLIGLI